MASEKSKGGRIGALDTPSFKSYSGNWNTSTADSPKENTLRGGSGTSQNEKGAVVGGDLSQEGVKNGYPSNS
jgi:hypothetical protein